MPGGYVAPEMINGEDSLNNSFPLFSDFYRNSPRLQYVATSVTEISSSALNFMDSFASETAGRAIAGVSISCMAKDWRY